jgi:hypothetical protein
VLHRSATLFVVVMLSCTALAQENGWLDRVSQTQEEQPHWITPLVTVTPRLEQEFRYDVYHQQLANGRDLWNVGGSKGLELIPTSRTEVIVGVPAYFVRDNPNSPDGFGDTSFLLKYRLAAGNGEHGSYIVSAFLGATVPTGSYRNGAESATVTPTLAAGKGFGPISVQSTLGMTFPTDDTRLFGHPVAFNTAFQYHVHRYFWPEVEVNSTFFNGGPNDGRKQAFITPGAVFGRFPIHNRVGFTFGLGMQIAATQFHTYNHSVVLTARLPF